MVDSEIRRLWHDADPAKGAIKVIMTGSASDKAQEAVELVLKQAEVLSNS